MGAAALISGVTACGIIVASETEAKEEENEEEKKKKPAGSVKKAPNIKLVNQKVELATALSQTQRNLGIIATNGALQPTVAQIQIELSKKRDTSQIEIININDKSAIIKAISNSTKYKDETTVSFTIDKSVKLSTTFADLNLGIIETNGQNLSAEMIKDKLKIRLKITKKIIYGEVYMQIITTKCYLSSCEKEYTLDSFYIIKINLYIAVGIAINKHLNKIVTKFKQK